MKSACLLFLASFTICNLALSEGQGISTEEDVRQRNTIDDIILQRAESLLLRSILKKLRDENGKTDENFSQPEWMTKRQHPGKRSMEDLEKRQHPGRREEDDDDDEQFLDMQKRQHPGKREEETHSFMALQKRQHPGKRSMTGHISDQPIILVGELSKRQHPGKRYLLLQSKRQHPGKRNPEEEDGDWNSLDDEDEEEMEKRQHPGKRVWDNSSPELETNSPCDALDSENCSKTSLLLNLLDNINKSHVDEKRQHPGKRSAQEEDLVEAE